MKLCVLSNSHAAALQLGWQRLAEEEGHRLEPCFFASRQTRLKHLRARKGQLVCQHPEVQADIAYTSNGRKTIDLAEFDAILIHALGVRMYYANFAQHWVSQRFMNEWLAWRWEQSLAAYLLQQIRSISDVPVILSPQPFWSESDVQLQQELAGWRIPWLNIPQQMLAFAERRFENITLLPQPQRTVTSGIFTKAKYSTGSKRLNVGDRQSGQAHKPNDHQHMNAGYGMHVWRDLLHLLEGLSISESR